MVLELCVVFLEVINMVKQVMLFDFHNVAFKNFQLKFAIRNLYPQNAGHYMN